MDPKIEMMYTDLEEIKDQMHENVFKMSHNVVNLAELDEKAQDLESSSLQFKTSASGLRRIFYCKDLGLKITIISIGTIVVGGLILIFILSNIDGKEQTSAS